MVEVAQFPVSRLYSQVTVFRPAREAEVLIIKHVTEIYGKEDGWDALTHHKIASNNGFKFIRSRRSVKDHFAEAEFKAANKALAS